MQVTEAINWRHSIRAFLSKPVEKEKLDAVLAASVRAPSWANTQPWEIFAVTGGSLERIKEGYRQKYAEKAPAAPETPRPVEWPEAAQKRIQQLRPDMERMYGASVDRFTELNQNMFGAPVVVYVCMDKTLNRPGFYVEF